ncbi:MAG: NAD-binding protein [Rhodocyclaceae bacterium]|nr:NAD-binding protein [Rhodocyclaceae bacterium]
MNFLVRTAYALEADERYAAFKAFCRGLLLDPRSRFRTLYDTTMIVLVLSSIILVIYEMRFVPGWGANLFEMTVTGLLILEYGMRLWLAGDARKIIIEHQERAELRGTQFQSSPALWMSVKERLAWMTTPMAIVDLLSILPGLRFVPSSQIFLIFRLFKLFRYFHKLSAFADVLVEKKFEFSILAIFVGTVLLTSTVAMYLFEAGQPGTQIHSFMDALYWAVITVTTVGYGDIAPKTQEGRLLAMALVFAGIAVLSFATSIIVTAFNEKMRSLRDHRTFSEVDRLREVIIVCGYGRIGQVVADRLKKSGKPFVVIDTSADAVESAQRLGYLAVAGDAANPDLLTNLGLGRQASCILCLTHDDASNVYITLTARQADPHITIISRANRSESDKKLLQIGANHVVRPYEVVANITTEFIDQPIAFDALYDVLTRSGGIRLEPVPIAPGSSLIGQRIGKIDFDSRHLILFGINRPPSNPTTDGHQHYELSNARFYFQPGPDFRLHPHDILMIFGHHTSLVHFRDTKFHL